MTKFTTTLIDAILLLIMARAWDDVLLAGYDWGVMVSSVAYATAVGYLVVEVLR